MNKIRNLGVLVALFVGACVDMPDRESDAKNCPDHDCEPSPGPQPQPPAPTPATPEQLCRAAAAETCDRIGWSGNEYCLIVFSQDCSADDRQRANEVCLVIPDRCINGRPHW